MKNKIMLIAGIVQIILIIIFEGILNTQDILATSFNSILAGFYFGYFTHSNIAKEAKQ